MNKEFRDWLEDKKRVSTYSYLNNGKLIIPNSDIEKELELVIKKYDKLHKPAVIPQYVADWIVSHRDTYDLYPALRTLEYNTSTWEQVYKWYRENTHEFVNAYLTGEYEVEEEPLYYALIKGHELVNDEGEWSTKYWNLWVSGGCVFPSDKGPHYDDFLTTMSKEEWSECGINDTNADFIKVEENE